MIQLNSPQHPYPDIPHIGIAIHGDLNQRHVGILFRTNQNEEPKLLHLAFHLRLRCDAPSEYSSQNYWLHCSGFSNEEQLQLAVWCKNIFAANKNKIPYGLAYSSMGFFDQNGTFIHSSYGCGLTCATFVMALFEDFGLPIIDITSWKTRADDAEWQKHIVDAIKEDHNKHPDFYSNTHIENQILNIGIALRFRPEEVAASVNIYKDQPITFQVAEPLGKDLVTKLLG
jgi:hypothetical protein